MKGRILCGSDSRKKVQWLAPAPRREYIIDGVGREDHRCLEVIMKEMKKVLKHSDANKKIFMS